MAHHKPHKQLKIIRHRLHITQRRAAAMLGISYPYLLSVETGQRELSHALAAKITNTFGVMRIADREAEPLIRRADGKVVPFSKEEYQRYKTTKPSFFIDADYTDGRTPRRVTPSVADYGRCATALLDAAEKQAVLGPVVADFENWFTKSITTDAMFEALKKSFDQVFPGERVKSDAYLALTVQWGLQLENEFLTEQARKAKAAARAARKRKKMRQTGGKKKKPKRAVGIATRSRPRGEDYYNEFATTARKDQKLRTFRC
jgi:transcriptional regulator with XRE-family HTH domain